MTASNARIPGDVPITIAGGTIRGSVIVYPDAPAITGPVRVDRGAAGDAGDRPGAGAGSTIAAGRGTLALVAKGSSGVPFDIAMQAALSPELIRANVRGTANGIAFRPGRPGHRPQDGGGAGHWPPPPCCCRSGQVVVEGSYGDLIRGRARLTNLDLSILRAFAPG